MTKPWEEMWRVRENDPWQTDLVIESDGDRQWLARFAPSPGVSPDHEAARASLAACAPELARMLLALETVSVRSDIDACPFCDAWRHNGVVPHEHNCEWLELMKRAGVR